MSDSQRTEEERTHTRILKTERELFFRNEISCFYKILNVSLWRGENATFIIKHNTDYIHYTFIKNVSVFKEKRLSVLI